MFKKVLMATLVIVAATSAHATSAAVEDLTHCLVIGDAPCSADLKVNTDKIAEGLLDGSLNSDDAAVLLKKANAIAKKVEEAKSQEK